MTNFERVVPLLSQALSKRGYSVLTPVQEAVIAPELNNADLLVSAQTGSGKTVAFGISLAPTLLEGNKRFSHGSSPLALVIAPTRELALQVKVELEWLYAETGALVTSCVGGMDMRMERRALERGAHIVVGTPGRLRDHAERHSLDLSNIKGVVLDEADEMLDMGFRDELEFILNATSKERRTLLFSATVPKSIVALAKRYQRNAVRISAGLDQEQHHDIDYHAYTVAAKDRENAIINVLRFYDAKTAIVFCATRATVSRMTSRFNNRGFSVAALSGELSQSQRTQALQTIRDGRARVCIATDVAARGLDLPNVELVIHADLPKNRESLLHRSGRTGRAGRKGSSVLIVPHNARKRTERLFQGAKIDATWANPPTVHEISKRDDERILVDPVLTAPLTDAEQSFAEDLLKSHSAEQIAAAFVRIYRKGQSAPEEISDAKSDDFQWGDRDGYQTKPRRDAKIASRRGPKDASPRRNTSNSFEKGVWFSLSVGRKHTAEARWLLPAIIRAGDLQKRDVGAIRIQENQTYFEIATESADKFMEALGPGRKLEKSMSVDRLGEMPKVLLDDRAFEAKSETRSQAMGEGHNNVSREYTSRKKEKPRSNNKNYKSKTPIEKRIYGEKPGQLEGDERTLRKLMENSRDEINTEPKQDLRSHPENLSREKLEGAKKKKSKKAKKDKGKRHRSSYIPADVSEVETLAKGPKLKFAKVINKKRARVTRKGGETSSLGEQPLKRNNLNNSD